MMSETASYFQQKYMSIKLDNMKRDRRLERLVESLAQAFDVGDMILVDHCVRALEEYVKEKR